MANNIGNTPIKSSAKSLVKSPAQLRQRMRLKLMLAAGILLVATIGLMLLAFEESIVFFHGPSEVVAGKVDQDRNFRLGGLVEAGSIRHEGALVHFWVSDGKEKIEVIFKGILPDLFREGQGIVALGKLEQDIFIAQEVLAKHDENYMPKEAMEAMKRAGTWQGEE